QVGGQVVGAVVLVAAPPAPAALGRLQLPRPELLVVVLLAPTTSASGTRRLVMVGERHARRPWCPGASEDAIDVKERGGSPSLPRLVWPSSIQPRLEDHRSSDLVDDPAMSAPPHARGPEAALRLDRREAFVPGHHLDPQRGAQLLDLLEDGPRRWPDGAVERQREPDDDDLGARLVDERRHAGVVAPAVAGALDHPLGGGEHATAVGQGDADAPRAEVEAERPGHPPGRPA